MRPSFIVNYECIIERRVIADNFNKYFVSLVHLVVLAVTDSDYNIK